MTTKDAIDILIRHNEWRRGGEDYPREGEEQRPAIIGAAIDTVCGLRLMAVAYEAGASSILIGMIASAVMQGHSKEKIIKWLDDFDMWEGRRDKILKG